MTRCGAVSKYGFVCTLPREHAEEERHETETSVAKVYWTEVDD